MNRARAVVFVLGLVALCAGTAQADGIDPGIIIAGGTGSINMTTNFLTLSNYPNSPGCTSGTNLQTVFGHPVDPSLAGLNFMMCVLLNQSPNAFTNIQITLSPIQSPPQYTLQCNVLCTGSTQTSTTVRFFFNPPGIPNSGPNREFAVVFAGWRDGTNFSIQTNVPEPATLALFGTGLLALATRLRRKSRG